MPYIASETFAIATTSGTRLFPRGAAVPADIAARVPKLVLVDASSPGVAAVDGTPPDADDATCDVCDRSFKNERGLARHAVTHDSV